MFVQETIYVKGFLSKGEEKDAYRRGTSGWTNLNPLDKLFYFMVLVIIDSDSNDSNMLCIYV